MTTTTMDKRQKEQEKSDGLMVAIFNRFKWWLLFASALAGIISVIYTIKFNTAQATAQDDKILLAVTGVVQDSAEYPFIAIGLIMLFMAKSLFYRAAGGAMAITGITLLLWSIAATFGSNNAIISESVAKTKYAEQQMGLINQVVVNSTATASTMQANSDAARAKAETYSSKYNKRASEQILLAQGHAEQAAAENNKALQALDSMKEVDKNALTQRNSAIELFKKMGTFLGVPQSTVENAFLLTRASQLEIITSIGVLVTVLVLLTQWKRAPAPQPQSSNQKPKPEPENKQPQAPAAPKPTKLNVPPMASAFNSTPRSGTKPFFGKSYSDGNTNFEPVTNEQGKITSQKRSDGYNVATGTMKKAKDAIVKGAEKGMEAGLEKGAYAASKFVAEANSTAPARQDAATNMIANTADKVQAKAGGRKPRQKNNAELMKVALLPEFRVIGMKVISGEIKPVHNQISKKLKLATPQKSLNILNLLEALGWIYQKQDKTRHLEANHQPTKLNLPLNMERATQEVDQIINYVKSKVKG